MNITFTFDGGIDRFISGTKASASQVDAMEDRIMRQAGIAGLENVASRIHSKTGKLVQSYTMGGTDNIFEVSAGGGHGQVRYGSNAKYAVAHEKGYNQSNRVSKKTGRKPSLWVPGSGSGRDFSYNPGADTGMKLSGRFVEGGHEFETSIPDTQSDFKKITKSEVERLFRALF